MEEDYYVAGLEFLEGVGVDMTTSSLGYSDWYTQSDLDGETAVAVNHTVVPHGHPLHAGDEVALLPPVAGG